MFKSLIQSRPRHDSKVILLQNVFSSSSHVCIGIAMPGTCSDVEQYVALYEVEELDWHIGQLSHYCVYLDQYFEEKTTWHVKTLKSMNQYHPIIWFLALPRSLLQQHNRNNTVLFECAILSFYYQQSKWNNGFRQRRRCSLFIDDANSVDL